MSNSINPEDFKKKPISSNEDILAPVKRQTFDIIFDNSSAGSNIINSLDKIADFIESGDVYDNVRFTIPLQIGTEISRLLFIDFLEDAMQSSKKKHVREFYNKNKHRINIVETDISSAYKFFYAYQAFNELKDEEDIEKILKSASKKIKGDVSIYELKKDFEDFKILTEKVTDEYNKHLKRTKNDIQKYISKLADIDIKPSHTKQLIEDMEKKAYGRAGRDLFKQTSDNMRYILQAMYSDAKLHDRLNTKKSPLNNYRKDKGERAIENYLQNHRNKTDNKFVTLVVSEDRKAIKRISDLRKSTNNSIIALREQGLSMMIENLEKSSDFIKPKKSDFSSSFKKPQDFIDEIEYAKKATELVLFGKYQANNNGINIGGRG